MKPIDATQLPTELIHKIDVNKVTTIIGGSITADYMQLNQQEKGKMDINGTVYKVHCLGLLNIDEAGGKDEMMKKLNLKNHLSNEYIRYKDWFEGSGKLYVYSINEK